MKKTELRKLLAEALAARDRAVSDSESLSLANNRLTRANANLRRKLHDAEARDMTSGAELSHNEALERLDAWIDRAFHHCVRELSESPENALCVMDVRKAVLDEWARVRKARRNFRREYSKPLRRALEGLVDAVDATVRRMTVKALR